MSSTETSGIDGIRDKSPATLSKWKTAVKKLFKTIPILLEIADLPWLSHHDWRLHYYK